MGEFIKIAVSALAGLISGIIGFVSAMLMYRYQERDRRAKEINNCLHALYLEVEENLIYCSNVKNSQLELLPLQTDAYLKFKLSEASLQIRGELLKEITLCNLRIQNFNKKAFAYEGGLLNPYIAKELSCVTEAIVSVQYILCKYLIEKKILPVIKSTEKD